MDDALEDDLDIFRGQHIPRVNLRPKVYDGRYRYQNGSPTSYQVVSFRHTACISVRQEDFPGLREDTTNARVGNRSVRMECDIAVYLDDGSIYVYGARLMPIRKINSFKLSDVYRR